MQAQSAGNALARSSERCRTLVACGGAVWIWPGIPLTVRRGAEIVPLPDATISFWVSRLHGPEVLDSPHPPHIAPISILSQIGGRKSLTCPKRGVRFLRALTLPPSLQRRPKRLTFPLALPLLWCVSNPACACRCTVPRGSAAPCRFCRGQRVRSESSAISTAKPVSKWASAISSSRWRCIGRRAGAPLPAPTIAALGVSLPLLSLRPRGGGPGGAAMTFLAAPKAYAPAEFAIFVDTLAWRE